MSDWTIHFGDTLSILPQLPEASVQCCVTSPPYWGLRDYGVEGQLGLEQTPDEYVARMVQVFREVRRVLRDDGTLWLNLGDSYARQGGSGPGGGNRELLHMEGRQIRNCVPPDGLKSKDLVGIPWRVAFALQADGWYLRQDIIWHKPNPMPESVRDRCTKAHEYIFLLAKSEKYYYDVDAIREPWTCNRDDMRSKGVRTGLAYLGSGIDNTNKNGTSGDGKRTDGEPPDGRNRRSVWTVATKPYKGAHFATFPPKLIEPCILAGCPVGGTVLDPFTGSGTTGAVALEHGRKFVGVELNTAYIDLAKERIGKVQPKLVSP